MRLTRITTKTGDAGKTLLGCELVEKEHPRVALLGMLDMLNCYMGMVGNCSDIQNILFNVGAAVYKGEGYPCLTCEVGALETHMKALNAELPPLREFVLPNNFIHLARAYCRETERAFWKEYRYEEEVRGILVYLNRLSDYLFVMARSESTNERVWNRT